MQTYFSVAQIVLSIALILTILFQVRGGGVSLARLVLSFELNAVWKRHYFNLPSS